MNDAQFSALHLVQDESSPDLAVISAEGVQAESVQALLAVDRAVKGGLDGGIKRLQLHRGRVRDGQFNIDHGQVTLKANVLDADVGLVDLHSRTAQSELRASAMQAQGDASIELSPQIVDIAEREPGSLTAAAVLDHFELTTQSPELHLTVSGNRQLEDGREAPPCFEGELRHIRIAPSGAQIEARNGWLRGNLHSGYAVIAPPTAAISKVSFDKGELDIEVARLHLATKGAETDVDFRGKVRLSANVKDDLTGVIQDAAQSVLPDSVRETLTRAGVAGRADKATLRSKVLLTMDAWLKNDDAVVESATRVRKGRLEMTFQGDVPKSEAILGVGKSEAHT